MNINLSQNDIYFEVNFVSVCAKILRLKTDSTEMILVVGNRVWNGVLDLDYDGGKCLYYI